MQNCVFFLCNLYHSSLKKFLQLISHLHTRILLTLLSFSPSQCCNNCKFIMYGFSLVRLLIDCVDSYSRNFGAINKWQNGEQNLSWNVYYWYLYIYTNAKFIVICKPRTLNDGRWRISLIRKTQKTTAS